MHKEIDKKEKRVYGGGMDIAATPTTVQSESALKLFYANTQKWLLDTWNKLPSQLIAAPGQTTKLVYTPMRWTRSLFQGVSGLTGLGGPSISGINPEQINAQLGNVVKNTISALTGTIKGAIHTFTHALSPEKKQVLDKAAANTASSMQSTFSSFTKGFKDMTHAILDWGQTLLLSGQTPAQVNAH